MKFVLQAIALTGGLTSALVAAWLEAIGFAASGLVACVTLFVVPGSGVILVLWGLARGRRKLAAGGGSLVLAAALALVIGPLAQRAQQEASQQRGDALCRALESYRQAEGAYPQTLAELVPTFTAGLPTTCMGLFRSFPFRYRTEVGGAGYLLWFDAAGFNQCERGRSGLWRCDD